jgi:hypothetical protein
MFLEVAIYTKVNKVYLTNLKTPKQKISSPQCVFKVSPEMESLEPWGMENGDFRDG